MMNKVISIAMVPLLALTLSACGNNSNNSNKDSSSRAATSQSTPKSADGNIDFTRYNAVKVGNTLNGAGGTTETAVKQSFGKPSSNANTDVDGKKSSALTWDKMNSSFKAKSVTVAFVNGKAVSKGYANLSPDKVTPIDQTKVDQIKKGATYESVIKALGVPHADTEAGINQESIKTIMYVTNKNGSATSFVFMDNKLNTITKIKIG
ncbi:DUF3862 domain-containing protein [Lactobacillaceae bacterium Scapto_B20]